MDSTLRKQNIVKCLLIVGCAILAACNDTGNKPASSSRPFEVLLIGDKNNIISNELSDSVRDIPQYEPEFDVTFNSKDNNKPWQKMSRAIVKVTFDKQIAASTIGIEQDVSAQPQIIVTITSPSAKELKRYINLHPGHIAKLLNSFELSCQLRALKTRHNVKAEEAVKRSFSIDMLIPPDMTASKEGKDFIWLSNNTNEGIQNLCIYKVGNRQADFKRLRDSVMKVNIPGERDGMYMETAYERNDNFYNRTAPAGSATLHRGLWDMRGDAMGGPFVAVGIPHGQHIIYIEAFVYAPENKKRNMIRRLEACLYYAASKQDRNLKKKQ